VHNSVDNSVDNSVANRVDNRVYNLNIIIIMIIYMFNDFVRHVDGLKSRDKYGNNIFASHNQNILDMQHKKGYKRPKRLSDIPTNRQLGWKGQIAKKIAPNYVDKQVEDGLGPFAGLAKAQIAYNNQYEKSRNDLANKKRIMHTVADKYFRENQPHYQNTLGNIRSYQQEAYGGKIRRKTRRKHRRKTRIKPRRKTRRKKTKLRR
jgi:hypothetical protein